MVLLDQDGNEIPEAVADQYRATSQHQPSVHSLVALYDAMDKVDSPSRSRTAAPPTSGQESHSCVPSHLSGGFGI